MLPAEDALEAGTPPMYLAKFFVWIGEIVCEAIGTSAILLAVALFDSRGDPPSSTHGISVLEVIGMSALVLIQFALTGYLVTTLLTRLFLPIRVQRFYPVCCATLYLLHSTVFFHEIGNPLLSEPANVFEFGGASLTFLITWLINRRVTRPT